MVYISSNGDTVGDSFADPSSPSLSDRLTVNHAVSIFHDYMRSVTAISERLINPLQKTTILAPVNSAIKALPRKPHEGASITNDEKVVAKYLAKWAKSHCIAKGEIELEDGMELDTLVKDRKVKFIKSDTKEGWSVVDGKGKTVEILQMDTAKDGQLWTLAQVLEWDD